MSKTNNFFNKPLNLMPNYFKKIGLGLILSTLFFMISTKVVGFHFIPEKKVIIKVFLRDIAILGMFFIAFSKEKDEDELTMQIRLKALASAFVFFIFSQISWDIINLISGEPLEAIKGDVFQSMIWYFFSYYTIKLLR
jgi:hypothetical protein